MVVDSIFEGRIGGALAMRVNSKGQVTIPAEMRKKAGLLPNTEVAFEFDGTAVRIVRVDLARRDENAGKRLVERLRGRASVAMSTDEILDITRS